MNTQSVKYPLGKYNPAGITKVWWAWAEDFLSFPVLPDTETATDMETLAKYVAAAVMKAGKKLEELYCTIEEGEIKTEMDGPRDGKGFKNSLEISFPGNTALMLGFQAAAANRPLIFFVKEKNGVIRVLGTNEDPAYFDANASTSGKKISDGRASVMTFSNTAATPAPIYTLPMAALLTVAA